MFGIKHIFAHTLIADQGNGDWSIQAGFAIATLIDVRVQSASVRANGL